LAWKHLKAGTASHMMVAQGVEGSIHRCANPNDPGKIISYFPKPSLEYVA
jgi:hypothetical protein